MAIFSSSPGADGAPPSSSRGPLRDNSLSIVAPGMRIVGELTTEGVVKVEGVVEGSIRAAQQILVARGGTVEGDLYTREAVIGGKVVGAIVADERVEVQAGSTIQGDITGQRIVIHEGGEVNGHVRMGRSRRESLRRPAGAGEGEPGASRPSPAQPVAGRPR